MDRKARRRTITGAPQRQNHRPTAGLGVDAWGGPAVDPTANVLHQFDLVVTRIDDIAELRAELADEKIKRMERDWIHLDRIATMRSEYEAMLRQAEAARLNSIRQVDREDVNKTATLNMSAIQTLQTQTTAMAETLRTQVANTASTLAAQLTQLFAESNKRVSALELASSEGRGKQAMSDPQMERLTALVEKLASSQGQREGKNAGIGLVGSIVIGAVGLVATLIGIGSAVYAVLK